MCTTDTAVAILIIRSFGTTVKMGKNRKSDRNDKSGAASTTRTTQ